MSDLWRILLIAAGVVVLAVLLGRPLIARVRARRRVRRALRAEDATERAEAGVTLVERNLRRAARPVLRRVAKEDDPRVRLAIAIAVLQQPEKRRQGRWVRSLRSWANQEVTTQRPGLVAA